MIVRSRNNRRNSEPDAPLLFLLPRKWTSMRLSILWNRCMYARNTAGYCSNASLVASHLVVASTRTACTDTRKEQLLDGKLRKCCTLSNERKHKKDKIQDMRERNKISSTCVFNRMCKVFSSPFRQYFFSLWCADTSQFLHLNGRTKSLFRVTFRDLMYFAFIIVSRTRNILNWTKKKSEMQGLCVRKLVLAKMETGLIYRFSIKRSWSSIYLYIRLPPAIRQTWITWHFDKYTRTYEKHCLFVCTLKHPVILKN